eukprot:152743_1
MPQTTQWIGDKLMKRLSLYDLIIHGNCIHDETVLTRKNQKTLAKLLQKILNGEISNYTNSPYVNQLIESLTTQNDKIWLNTNQINELTHEELKKMFVSETDEDFGTFILHLKEKVKVLICPIFVTNWKMNDATFDFISRAVDSKYKNMNVVIQGPTIKCNMSNNRMIVFQPQLTKNENVFHLQMKLVSVEKNSHSLVTGKLENEIALSETMDNKMHLDQLNKDQVKVHFNVSCNQANGYYTSLHPRMMDVKFDNAFDITLPLINDKEEEKLQAISFGMSMILHNFEDFDIEYNDLSSLNIELMTQNMDHGAKSYKIADCLSVFYGLSNSVISVVDSISDILFIVFLFYIDTQENQSIPHTFLSLTIANLLSVAVFISVYMCYQIHTESWLSRAGLFVLFFVLSPILPSFEWISKQLQIESNDFIIVAPDNDGILIWLQQELVRNKIFLMECLFESYFQIIIQFAALFAFEGIIETDIYLFGSIFISLMVIMSKCILISYNMRRIKMMLNFFCYFMDIVFGLIFGVFITVFLLKNVFCFTGLYLIFEFAIFIPLYCYYFSYLLGKLYLTIPMGIILFYPYAMWSLASFSTFPMLSYVQTNPNEIGRKEEFHDKMYQYCKHSKNTKEYEQKIVIINYLCIKTYFEKLTKSYDEEYYDFAEWLFKLSSNELPHINMQIFTTKGKHFAQNMFFNQISKMISLHGSQNETLTILNIKICQIAFRLVMIIISMLLDVFYLKIFNDEYGFIQTLLAITLILFVVWSLWIIYETFASKWNHFCLHMIASKHEKFGLLITVSEFIQQCDDILTSYYGSDHIAAKFRYFASKKYEDVQLYEQLSFPNKDDPVMNRFVIIILFLELSIFLCIVIPIDFATCNRQATAVLIFQCTVMIIAALICNIAAKFLRFRRAFIGYFFGSFTSGICSHFLINYNTSPCKRNFLQTPVLILLIIGCLFSLYGEQLILFMLSAFQHRKDVITERKANNANQIAQSENTIRYDWRSGNIRKITILGAGGTSKSAITVRMVANEFQQEYDPTIEANYTCTLQVDGKNETLDILDTAGQEQFAALQHHWIRESQAFMLLYDVNSERTFAHARELYKNIQRNKEGERIDVILVGAKAHLPENQHEITYKMGKQLADEWNCPFIEVSAKTGVNVNEAFEMLVKEMKKDKHPEPLDIEQKDSCCVIL